MPSDPEFEKTLKSWLANPDSEADLRLLKNFLQVRYGITTSAGLDSALGVSISTATTSPMLGSIPLTSIGGIHPLMTSTTSTSSRIVHWFDQLRVVIEANAASRILLVGPPGTGKSTTAKILLASSSSKSAQRITITEGTGVEDLIGMYHLREGETVWVDGPVTTAMRLGTGVILDEIDHMPTEIQSLAYAILDDEPQITLPTGENVSASEGYKVICTSNANISALPEAIIDRVEVVFIANKPHPNAMTDLAPDHRAAVESYYSKLASKQWQWSGLVTLRRMRAYHKVSNATLKHSDASKRLTDRQAASLVFGEAGAEVLSVLSTAGR